MLFVLLLFVCSTYLCQSYCPISFFFVGQLRSAQTNVLVHEGMEKHHTRSKDDKEGVTHNSAAPQNNLEGQSGKAEQHKGAALCSNHGQPQRERRAIISHQPLISFNIW